MSSRKNKAESRLHKKSLVCFWLQSYVATRFGASFSACQRAFMCIFLHACHAAGQGGSGGVGGGRGAKNVFCLRFLAVVCLFCKFQRALDATLRRSSLVIYQHAGDATLWTFSRNFKHALDATQILIRDLVWHLGFHHKLSWYLGWPTQRTQTLAWVSLAWWVPSKP